MLRERLDTIEPAEELDLHHAAGHLLEECRMVLPGIQALFGFQLVAVFSQGFDAHLSMFEQKLHFVAITLVVLAIGLVMAPAALHRQAEPHAISYTFLTVSSRLLILSMVPLAIGICLDVYLVGRVILHSSLGAAITAGALFAVLILLWMGPPAAIRARRRREKTN